MVTSDTLTLSDGFDQELFDSGTLCLGSTLDFDMSEVLAGALKQATAVGKRYTVVETQIDMRSLGADIGVMFGHLLGTHAIAGDLLACPNDLQQSLGDIWL